MQPKQQTGSGSKRKRDQMGRSTDDAAPAAPSSSPQSAKKSSGTGSVIALWGPLLIVGLVIWIYMWIYGGQDRDSGAIQEQATASSNKASQAKATQPPMAQGTHEASALVAEAPAARQLARADLSSPPAESAIAIDNGRAEATVSQESPAGGALDSHSATAVTPAQLASSTPATRNPAQEQNRAKVQDTHAGAASPAPNEVLPPQEPSAVASPHGQEGRTQQRVNVSDNEGTGEVSGAEHTDNSVGAGAKSPKPAAPDKQGPGQNALPEPSPYYYRPQAPAYYFRPPMWTSYLVRRPLVTANPHLPPCSHGVTNSSRLGPPCVGPPHALTPYPSVWKRPRPYAQRFTSYW